MFLTINYIGSTWNPSWSITFVGYIVKFYHEKLGQKENSLLGSSIMKWWIEVVLLLLGMIMGAAASTVYYNLKLRHPTIDMPIIDYDLTLLIQPMLMLGISIGVAFNVIFADWMVTVLLIILFIGKL